MPALAEDKVLNLASFIKSTARGCAAQRRGNRSRSGYGRLVAGLIGAAVVMVAAKASAATFDCVMDPYLTVKLGSPVMSVLSEVLVDRGDLVKKGQVIARIESGVEEAAV